MVILEKWGVSWASNLKIAGCHVGTGGKGGNEHLHQDNRPDNTSKLLVLVKEWCVDRGDKRKGRTTP